MIKSRQRGFSLMELLIVLTIIGTLAGVMLSNRGSGVQKEYRRFFRRFSTMTKEMRSRSQIKGTTLRFVFQLEEDKPPKFWVEEAKGTVLLSDSKKTKEAFEELYESSKESQAEKKKKGKDEEKKRTSFKRLKRFSSKRLPPPSSITIKQIEIAGFDRPINEEVAFFHFFPEGFVEEVAIQFQTLDESIKWTLVTEPLTGEMTIIKGHTDLKELQDRD